MKKFVIIGLFILGIFTQNCFGQLRVDSVGHVGLGEYGVSFATSEAGSWRKNLYEEYIAGARHGLYSESGDTTAFVWAWGYALDGYSDVKKVNFAVGLKGTAMSKTGGTVGYGRAFGVYARAGDATSGYNYAVYGQLEHGDNGAAIFGSSSTNFTSGINTQGRYAGYFVGNIKATGNLELSGGSIITSSVPSMNTSGMSIIELSSSRDKTTADRLSQLPIVSYYEPLESLLPPNETDTDSLDRHTDLPRGIESLTTTQKAYLEKVHYGIPIEQLEEYYPELVCENENGSKGINYIEMVPLLLQSIKELNAKIEELQGNDIKKAPSRNAGATTIGDTEADLFSVSQNEPNPFTESTTIKLSIPKKTQRAALMIYDMSGKQIKQININERGKTSVNITSEGLAAGMYLYSLIADGKVINTKRMILTK